MPALKRKLGAAAAPIPGTLSDGAESSASGSDSATSSGSRSEPDSESESESVLGSDTSSISSRKTHLKSRVNLSPSPEPPSAAPSFSTAPSRIKIQPRSQLTQQKPNSSSSSVAAHPLSSHSTAPTETFTSLGISRPLVASMGTLSIRLPTPIQSGCLKAGLEGKSVIGISPTGSGKTLAFALPMLQGILRDIGGLVGLVLAPTRELAYQLSSQISILSNPLGIKTVTITGGMDFIEQSISLAENPQIVVATPGRLVYLLKIQEEGGGVREWGLERVKTLILDEADMLLTPTFSSDLSYILSKLPQDGSYATGLFTATETEAVKVLEDKPGNGGRGKPFVFKVVGETTTPASLKQYYLFIPSHVREVYLYYLLLHPPSQIEHMSRANPLKPRSVSAKKLADDVDEDKYPPWPPQTIIFVTHPATCTTLSALLKHLYIPSVSLHSHLSQPQRLAALRSFRASQIPVLIATDVASRGLDIPEVGMVVNWDFPRGWEAYTHRVGRTGRAGRGGVGISFVTERDTELVAGVEEGIKMKLEEYKMPEEEVLESLNKVSTAKRLAVMDIHDQANIGSSSKDNNQRSRKQKKVRTADDD